MEVKIKDRKEEIEYTCCYVPYFFKYVLLVWNTTI